MAPTGLLRSFAADRLRRRHVDPVGMPKSTATLLGGTGLACSAAPRLFIVRTSMSRCLGLARRSLLAALVLIASSALAHAAGERRAVIIDQDMFGPGGSNMNSVLMLLQ